MEHRAARALCGERARRSSVLEPSCLLTLRDEYPEFIRTEAAKKVAKNSFLFEEFVMREIERRQY